MITPSFGLTATERVLPKLALDFTTALLDPRVTFTRSGNTATVVNSSGLIATINADLPRFDYDPATLTCKGLLIEEGRTNICLQSQDFSTTWYNGQSSEAVNVAVSPDGTQNADKLIEDTNAGSHQIRQDVTTTAVSTTFSVFVKAAERSWVALAFTDSSNAIRVTYFDVGAGAVGTVGANTTASIRDAGNGWWRCAITLSAAFAGANNLRIQLATGDNGNSYTGNGTDGIYIWGAQLEAGAFPTSYIPTTTTALTRNADVAVMTGTNFSNWFNASEGTFSIKADLFDATSTAVNPFGQVYGTATTTLYMGKRVGGSGTNNFQFFVIDTTTQAFVQADSVLSISNVFRTGVSAYKANSFQAACAKVLGTQDTSGTVPSGMTAFNLGSSGTATAYLNGHIAKVNYWPQCLTNAEVQAFSK